MRPLRSISRVEVVQPGEQLRDPAVPCSVSTNVSVREALEHARHDAGATARGSPRRPTPSRTSSRATGTCRTSASPVPPACAVTGRSRSSHDLPDRVVLGCEERRRSTACRATRREAGRRAGRAPWPQMMSCTASSTSFRKICVWPARRPGRLRAEVDEPAVVGADADEPAARSPRASGRRRSPSRSGRTAARCSGRSPRRRRRRRAGRRRGARRPSCGCGRRPGDRGTDSSTSPRHASNSSCHSVVRYSRYVAWLAPAWQSDEMIV